MSEYAYVSKDKSYALKHYGVKGMKWHKHLRKKIGFDDYDRFTKYGDAFEARRNKYNSWGHEESKRRDTLSVKTRVARQQFDKTPAGKVFNSSHAGAKAVDLANKFSKTKGAKAAEKIDEVSGSIDKALRKRNVKKRKKQGEAYREQVKKDYRQKTRKYNDERIASQYKDRANMAKGAGVAGYREDGTPIKRKKEEKRYPKANKFYKQRRQTAVVRNLARLDGDKALWIAKHKSQGARSRLLLDARDVAKEVAKDKHYAKRREREYNISAKYKKLKNINNKRSRQK